MTGLLSGVRVLDLSGLLPGPYATLLLADMGADVIKVESRLGDLLRQSPPLVRERSAMFLTLNRSKRSVGIHLKSAAGRRVFLDLCRESDVVVEGFRPGRAERLGVGPDDVHRVNARLVYCRISGFGQSGPDASRSGHDLGYLARSGLLGLMRDGSGQPVLPATQIADLAAGTTAAMAVCAALVGRERTGRGAVLDINMLEAVLPWLGVHLEAFRAGMPATAGAMPLGGAYPFYNVYRTADGGHVALAALEPVFWRDFCRAIERPDLAALQFPGKDHEHLFRELASVFGGRTAAEWSETVRAHDLPAEVVADVAAVLADAHLLARGAFLLLEHPVEGTLHQVRVPVRVEGATDPAPGLPPDLAAHTREVLHELLDLDDERINDLVRSGAVFESDVASPRRIAPERLP